MHNIHPPYLHMQKNMKYEMQNTTCPTRSGKAWCGKKNMTNTLKYAKYAEYQILGRYVFVTFRELYSQHHLWFYVQVYAT